MSIIISQNMANKVSLVCFGEVLWDCFGETKRLGGAPLNMCFRVKSLGIDAQMISAVGEDRLGNVLLDELKEKQLSTEYIAVSPHKNTSTVLVALDSHGSAKYEIISDTAWDNIVLTDEIINKVESTDIFVFGSLIGRTETSLITLKQLLEHAKFKVFDVNLRSSHYHLDNLIALMNSADFIKLNDDELYEIAKGMGCKYHSLEQNLDFIAKQTNTEFLCVTKGNHGALLSIKGKNYYNSGYRIDVVDTVGAGDSFLGALIYQLCTYDDPQQAIDFACAAGAMVAQQLGATPNITYQQILEFIEPC